MAEHFVCVPDDYEYQYADYRVDKTSDRYYELIIDADEMTPPIICIEKYRTFDEVSEKPSILACGGTAFVLFRYRNGEREIVSKYCSVYDNDNDDNNDGWIDEGRLEWETEENEQKFLLKQLAAEAMERHPEYIRQKEAERIRKEAEEEEKCASLIAKCLSNLESIRYKK